MGRLPIKVIILPEEAGVMNLRRSAVAHLIASQAIWVILAYLYSSVSAHDVDIETSSGSVPGAIGQFFSAPIFLNYCANSAGEFTLAGMAEQMDSGVHNGPPDTEDLWLS